MNHAEFLYNSAYFMVITAAVKALVWLKKKRKDDENCVLPGCQFATLVMLSGDIDILVGQGSVRIQRRQVP